MISRMKKILSASMFLLLFFFGLWLLYQVFSWKDTTGDYFSSVNQMYSMKKNTVDVAFFGPSAYYSSLNPAVFWESNGIASFNAAVSGQDRNAAVYFIKELLKTQSPKVVLVSATSLYTDSYAVPGNLMRNTLSLRESLNSVLLIRELCAKNKEARGENTYLDYVLRWPIVHGRYRELKRGDFVPVNGYENCLGFSYGSEYGIVEAFDDASLDFETSEPISSPNVQWMDELLALGEKNGFQVIVVSVPTVLSEAERACLNGCFRYFDEKGIAYVDLNARLDDMDFDPATDMTDFNHANTYGADKISLWLSDYLAAEYTLPDRRGQKGYERYDECLETYRHNILATDQIPYWDSADLAEAVSSRSGLITAVTLRPNAQPAEEFTGLLQSVGVTPQELERGGTWILKDGALVCRPGSQTYGYPVNESEYLYVTASQAEGFDSVSVGKHTFLTPADEGCYVLTYDVILDKVIDVREIY